MGFNHLEYEIQKLTHDEDEKIATLAEAIQQLMQEK
jgi:hypothetical protein